MNTCREISLRLLGPASLLFLGDTMVFDRWKWIRSRLPATSKVLADVGCGNGWLALNFARVGYQTLGIGWAGPDIEKATARAAAMGSNARFEVQDIRQLSVRSDLKETFDVVTCLETIEHIIDDVQVMIDLTSLLRPGGRLLLTTPNEGYVPIDVSDAGPFSTVETGEHVRKGYTQERLSHLADQARLEVLEIGFCSGWASQKVTGIMRGLSRRFGYRAAWAVTLPLRLAPPLLDKRRSSRPPYSICLVARKGE